ncbi:hypothetical protein [Legionella maceachernii]|nr:hypothetical protein [Legionella maceachernii]
MRGKSPHGLSKVLAHRRSLTTNNPTALELLMANLRVIHLALMRKEQNVVIAAKPKQKTFNSPTFGSNPSISHEIWRLPKVFELRSLLAAKSNVARLFE